MLDPKKKTQLGKRLNRIAGQVHGIRKMVEEPRYCVEILTQIAAARAALAGVGKFVLEDHLNTCVSTAIRRGAAEREIKELMDVFEKF
ncbi:MAG: metal-sensitive transcriptional regulator [Candidatus Margulisiibacteriota bacterium]